MSKEARRHVRKAARLNQADEVEGLKLGRYPFAAAIPHYLDRRRGTIADSTYYEEEMKLREFAKVFEQLKAEGKIKTTDPRHMTRHEVQEFMAWMRREHIDPNTQTTYMTYLGAFLRCFKNFIIEEMKADGVKMPKRNKKPIRVIAEDDLEEIFSVLETMEGWNGSMARGMIALYFATGVRPSELRLAHFEDLDIKKRTLFVRHPKGEGSWASAETVDIIRQDMLRFVERFVAERKQHLRKEGIGEALALFPNLSHGANGFYSITGFRRIKCKVERLSSVEFRLKDFRSTLTSMTVNGDLSRLPAMSAQLRHSTTTTTQQSYFRMEQGVAGKQLKDAWKEHPIRTPKNPVIESSFDNTGYA